MSLTNTIPGSIAITLPVSRQLLSDLLCTAIEGGSNYWCEFTNLQRDPDTRNYTAVDCKDEDHDTWTTIDLDALALGLSRLAACIPDDATGHFPTAAQHFADALGDHDATTADVVLQFALFNEVVYG